MPWLGDYAEDFADLNFKFTTRDASGAPTTLSGTPAVSCYKSNNTTQSTAGITLTADFDSVTGLNNVKIDLSADAFYETGEDYAVVITTGTVDSVSVVGEVVAHFSIENRFNEVDVTKWLGTAAATPTTAGVPEVDVTHWAGTATTISSTTSKPEVDVNSISDDATAADNLESACDNYSATRGLTGTALPAVAAGASGGVPTGDANARVDVGSWLGTAVTTSSTTSKPEVDVNSVSDDATAANNLELMYDGTGYAGGTTKLGVDVVSISGDSGAADNLESEYDGTGYGHVLQRTTIATLTSQTEFTLTAGSADNDAYNYCIVVIQDASTAAQKAVGVCSDYVGSTKTLTLNQDPGIFTMATTDIVTIIADRSLKPITDNVQIAVGGSGEVDANAIQISGDTNAADNLEADYDGTGYTKTNSTVGTVTDVTNEVNANITKISSDATAADNLELDYDGTGYAKTNSTIGTATTVTNTVSADAVQISGSSDAADKIEEAAERYVLGTVDNSSFTPTTTQFECDDITDATADWYIGRTVLWRTSTNLANSAALITDYELSGSNGKFTVRQMHAAPSNNDTLIIV